MKKKQRKQKSAKLEAGSLRKSWLFYKINKPLARLVKEEREKNQINKIRNENGEIITENTEIQRIIETTVSNYMLIK